MLIEVHTIPRAVYRELKVARIEHDHQQVLVLVWLAVQVFGLLLVPKGREEESLQAHETIESPQVTARSFFCQDIRYVARFVQEVAL